MKEDEALQKRMRVLRWILGGLCSLLLLGCGAKGITEERFDFTNIAEGLPLGWSVQSYENRYTADCVDGVVTLHSDVADDCRLLHTIPVSGGERYVLRAEIATENVLDGEGATLSIDNFGMDGSYIYSSGLHGTNDWTPVALAFETDRTQKSVQLALRLGGYSSVSSGTARFRSVSIEQNDKAGSYQKLVPVSRTEEQKRADRTGGDYEAFFSLLFWATVIAAIGLLFGVYRNRERLMNAPMDARKKRRIFAGIVLIGLIVRLALCKAFGGHATDMGCWIGWGNQIADGMKDGTLAAFYSVDWYDYPPGYMLVLGALTWIMRLLRVEMWGSETLRLFWYMLPAFLSDIACGVLLVRFAKDREWPDAAGLLLGGLIVLNPAAVYLSGAWAQIDSILTLFLLLAYGQFRRGRRIFAALLYAVAVLIKWQALVYGPVLAACYFASLYAERHDKKRLLSGVIRTGIAVVSAVALIWLVALPFSEEHNGVWIVQRFLSASRGYRYATVEGYNFFAMLGGNWAAVDGDLFFGAGVGRALLMTLNAFGKLVAAIGAPLLGIAVIRQIRDRKNGIAWIASGATALLCLLFHALTLLNTDTNSFSWVFYGVAVLLGLAGAYARDILAAGGLKSFLKTDEQLQYGVLALALGAAVLLGDYTLWMGFRLFGWTLSFEMLGTIMIVLGGLFTLWMLWTYIKAGRGGASDPELIYTLSAFFMLWVFTFGHFMHERYIFPVLILLLFAFAANRDKRFLLGALLLTVTTLLNETVAMYVVSPGAIDAIRGGEIHNLFLRACATAEVASALYVAAVCAKRAIHLQKGGRSA